MIRELGYPHNLQETQKITEAKHAGEYFALQTESRKSPAFPRQISAVLIFGCSDNENWMQEMNINRIRSAIRLTKTLTTVRKKQAKATDSQNILSKADYLEFSPYLIYNGTIAENSAFQKYCHDNNWPIPKDKTLILNSFRKNNENCEHINTKDQIQSLFANLESKLSPIYKAEQIALVSHSPHFMRIRHYIKNEEEKYQQLFGQEPTFWAYSPKLSIETFKLFMDQELEKLANYLQRGEIPHKPSNNVFIA